MYPPDQFRTFYEEDIIDELMNRKLTEKKK